MRWSLALVGLVLAWAVMLLFGAMEFDRGLLILFYAGTHPRLAEAARWVTRLGDTPMLLAASAFGTAWLALRRDWRAAAILLAVTLSGRWLVALQKDWTARVRPDAQGRLIPVDSFAFPSGHAANATLVLLCLALLLPRTPQGRALGVWAAVWLAIAIGASRVMLGVHWPSDVIGGWAFGLFWTLLFLRLSGVPLIEGTAPAPAHSLEEGDPHDRPEQARRDRPPA